MKPARCELLNPAFAPTLLRVFPPSLASAARWTVGVGAWSGVRSVCAGGAAEEGTESAAAEPCVAVREEVSEGGEGRPRLLASKPHQHLNHN